jgi:hypothetical protein
MAADDIEPQDVFDHLMELADDAGLDQFDAETLHDSVNDMTNEQLETFWETETWEDVVYENQADDEHPLKYH